LREGWQRETPAIAIDRPAIERLVRAAFPAARIRSFRPESGGLANTNVRVLLWGGPKAVLVRLYQRDPAEAPKEAALNALVLKHGVPTARFFHAATTNEVTGGPYAIMEWIDGFRLRFAIPLLRSRELLAVAREMGHALAAIHAIGFEHSGLLQGDLRVAAPVDLGREGLLTYLRLCLIEGIGGARLGPALTARLLAYAEREGGRLEAWLGQPCLTHADFNADNIMVRRGNEVPRIAVLDWEFAFSGSPAFDFGHLLRPPLGRRGGFLRELTAAYQGAGGHLPPDWPAIARIADLYAWADFLARPGASPALIADARRMIRRTIGR
jgi:aminoglycoside phosphotransferase (APT) family kinase protein